MVLVSTLLVIAALDFVALVGLTNLLHVLQMTFGDIRPDKSINKKREEKI